jgi:hypothetical protein
MSEAKRKLFGLFRSRSTSESPRGSKKVGISRKRILHLLCLMDPNRRKNENEIKKETANESVNTAENTDVHAQPAPPHRPRIRVLNEPTVPTTHDPNLDAL